MVSSYSSIKCFKKIPLCVWDIARYFNFFIFIGYKAKSEITIKKAEEKIRKFVFFIFSKQSFKVKKSRFTLGQLMCFLHVVDVHVCNTYVLTARVFLLIQNFCRLPACICISGPKRRTASTASTAEA